MTTKLESDGLMEIAELHRLLAVTQHTSIVFHQDDNPEDYSLIAPYRSQKCPDCGLLMVTVEGGYGCVRCGLEVPA